MAVRTKVEPLDRDIAIILSEELSAEAHRERSRVYSSSLVSAVVVVVVI